jgi:hypothetical protein
VSNDRVRLLVDALIDGVTATPAQVQGLTETQIDEVERDQLAPLAAAYRRFLALAGGGAGHFLRGSDVFYPQLLGLGEAALELLQENNSTFVLTEECSEPVDRKLRRGVPSR